MKNILLIGGNGIVGSAITHTALENGYEVTSLGLGINCIKSSGLHHIDIDRYHEDQVESIVKGFKKRFDGVVDIIGSTAEDAKQVHELFRATDTHIFGFSSTLVYDRSKPFNRPITSGDKLAELGDLGGYVDKKLGLEAYYAQITDVPYTLLRPYHILGKGAFLGCIPPFNRSPDLVDRIKNDQPISLCNEGRIPLNIIHALDIAKVIMACVGNFKSRGKKYNVVNPEVVYADEYFCEIGRQLGKAVHIVFKPITEVWNEGVWELTTLPHIYDVSDMQTDLGFAPQISFKTAIADALETYSVTHTSLSAVHERMNVTPHPRKIDWVLHGKF